MKRLSIKAHLWIAFAVIPIIPVVFLSTFPFMQSKEPSWQAIVLYILLALGFTLLLGYFHARRINHTIQILVDYIQEVMSAGNVITTVNFPRFAPHEFQLMAEQFFLLAQKNRAGQQALLNLNAELEQRVADRTKSLQRTNRELAVLNRLNTSVIPNPGSGNSIRDCLNQFFEISGVRVKLYLTKPVFSLLGPYDEDMSGIADREAAARPQHKNAYRYYIQPIRSGHTTFGHLVVSNWPLSQEDRNFIETMACAAGSLIQKEMLSHTLQKNNAVLKAVLESMNDAIILVDNRHEVAYANGRMAKLLGIAGDMLRGLQEAEIFEAIAGRIAAADKQTLQQAREAYGIYTFKMMGEDIPRYMMLSAFPVVGEETHTIGKGFVWWDVTREQEIDKLKSDLISMVSHEFKTPITSIKGSVETLLRVDAQWEEDFKWEMLRGIHEDIDRIQELVDDWLDISRIDAKAIGLEQEPVRLSAVVDHAVKKLPKHFASGVMIESMVAGNLPFIYADRHRLAQVLLNLFTNAIRYNKRSPHIKISANCDADSVYIHVADNGIGIHKKHVDQIFDRFYCVENGGERPAGSTGLGLAICKGIVEAHGGSISVQSVQGTGSIFTIAIPQYKCEDDEYEER